MKTIQVLLPLIAFLIDGLFFSLHGERIQIGYYFFNWRGQAAPNGVGIHIPHIHLQYICVSTFVYKCIGRQAFHSWSIWATGLGDERKVRDVFL